MRFKFLVLLIILAVLFLVSFMLGKYPLAIIDVLNALTGHIFDSGKQEITDTVVFQIRLPRIIAAIMVGACLAISGAVYQGFFRNPLVSPDILGVSSGAGFGAAVGILLSGNGALVQLSAFVCAFIAVAAAYGISKIVKGNATLALVLSGMAIASLFAALISLVKYVADPIDQLPNITYWLMGSFAAVKNNDLLFAAGPMVIGMAVLLLVRWRLNVLAMGDEEAKALGVSTDKFRLLIVVCCTLITASAVCISGIIGWVGLIIPHIGRSLVGPDHKKLLPVSGLLGAIYLLFIDNICRNMLQIELPIGILTAIIGAPFFIFILAKEQRGWF